MSSERERLQEYERQRIIQEDLIDSFGDGNVAGIDEGGELAGWSILAGRVVFERDLLPCDGAEEDDQTTATRRRMLERVRSAYDAASEGVRLGQSQPQGYMAFRIDRSIYQISDRFGRVKVSVRAKTGRKLDWRVDHADEDDEAAEVAERINHMAMPRSTVDPSIDPIYDALEPLANGAGVRINVILDDSRVTTEPFLVGDREALAHVLWRREERKITSRS